MVREGERMELMGHFNLSPLVAEVDRRETGGSGRMKPMTSGFSFPGNQDGELSTEESFSVPSLSVCLPLSWQKK